MKPDERFFPFDGDFRDPFDRDRDRIVHCGSFRKLEYKTQVFLNSEGDAFRTRLTHSLEVSQLARTIAKHLGLNVSLAEAIALSHDIGHTPFGHIGGDTLDECLKEAGSENGFEHNFQSFRVLSKLEKRYAQFDGLNLCFATLEGVLKHSAPYKKSFLPPHFEELFALDFHPSFEAVVVDNADAIAYVSADIDDALAYGIVDFEQLCESELVKTAESFCDGLRHDEELFRYRLSSQIIRLMVQDFVEHSKANGFNDGLEGQVACSAISAKEPLKIGFSSQMKQQMAQLKRLLMKKVYRHETILRPMYRGKNCIRGLFKAFSDEPLMLPQQFRRQLEEKNQNRVVADFIASLSDRGAMELYAKLF